MRMYIKLKAQIIFIMCDCQVIMNMSKSDFLIEGCKIKSSSTGPCVLKKHNRNINSTPT